MWALMDVKTTEAYKVVLQQFTAWAPHIQPQEIIVDFESALTAAINNIYPHATIIHCWFHFLQVSSL